MNYLLNQSFKESKAVEIIYKSKGNVFSKRNIIVKAVNENYIKAYCLKKRQPRIFRVDSILAVAPIKNIRGDRFYA